MTPIRVPVRCEHRFDDGTQCHEWEPLAHVHEPPPCRNGRDDRHHDYVLPKTVRLLVGGQQRRVRFARAVVEDSHD